MCQDGAHILQADIYIPCRLSAGKLVQPGKYQENKNLRVREYAGPDQSADRYGNGSYQSSWHACNEGLLCIFTQESDYIGTLPPSWSALSTLRVLDLNQNYLQGRLTSPVAVWNVHFDR